MRSKLVLIIVATGFWYFSSSINAVASQKLFQGLKNSSFLQNALDELNASTNKEATGIISIAVILTVSQLVAGGIISLAFLFFFGGDNNSTGSSTSSATATLPFLKQQRNKSKAGHLVQFFQQIQTLDLLIGFLHCIGSICTNIGYGYGSASLVQVIKLLEPIETLLLMALLQRSLQVLSFHKVVSTITIVGGTYMLLSNPSIEVNPTSVLFSIGSGICMASRNVFSKKRQLKQASMQKQQQQQREEEGAKRGISFRAILVKGITKFATITITSAGSAVVIGLFMALYSLPLFELLVPQLMHFSPKILTQTIVFHCLYNMASITVLSLTSATSHSLLNVGKRIANVIIASMAFDIPVTIAGKIGLVVAAIGACFYNDRISAALWASWMNRKVLAKKTGMPWKKLVVGAVALFVVFLQLFQSMEIVHNLSTDTAVMDHHNFLGTSNATRSHKVVLLGPHDRYNFGDLLFSKVIAKLLESRAGYSSKEILYGGLISVDMEAYGGPKSVQSMKEIQSLSRSNNNNNNHSYDIIYTGGQALGCDFWCALNMMPTAELKAQAKRNKIHGCGYLFPKRLLRPKQGFLSWFGISDSDNNNRDDINYAVVNSMGGDYVSYYCKEAVNTADYAAYRDHDPLYPDSAVMTKELFSDEIQKAGKEALEELGLAPGQTFVAVQHKTILKEKDTQDLASALDAVARGLKAKVVFFAAGTAPGHDSLESYDEVASLMKEDAVVYRAEHVWKVVGLVSRATAVLSTSLHVRIMAFIHSKPRLTWCKNGEKHSLFIALWDTDISAPCLEDKSNSWTVLEKHYLLNPDQAKSSTDKKYKELVDKYLESFSNYSRMLRPQIAPK